VTGARYPLTGSATIPATINGTSITAIGASAFANCGQLSEITIPASVSGIGSNAFSNCTGLKTVNIGRKSSGGITTAGAGVFGGCASLNYICMADSVSVEAYRAAEGWKWHAEYINLTPEWETIANGSLNDKAYTRVYAYVTVGQSTTYGAHDIPLGMGFLTATVSGGWLNVSIHASGITVAIDRIEQKVSPLPAPAWQAAANGALSDNAPTRVYAWITLPQGAPQ
jgi:hypothetical protein